MTYEELSTEAKEVVKGMVEHCLNRELCMGPGGGYTYTSEPVVREGYRVELEAFVGYSTSKEVLEAESKLRKITNK